MLKSCLHQSFCLLLCGKKKKAEPKESRKPSYSLDLVKLHHRYCCSPCQDSILISSPHEEAVTKFTDQFFWNWQVYAQNSQRFLWRLYKNVDTVGSIRTIMITRKKKALSKYSYSCTSNCKMMQLYMELYNYSFKDALFQWILGFLLKPISIVKKKEVITEACQPWACLHEMSLVEFFSIVKKQVEWLRIL